MSALSITLILLLLFILASIVWSTLAVGISPMPSNRKSYRAIMVLIDEVSHHAEGPIVDLGSGWGNLIVRLALKYPQRKIIGYELSLIPWLTSKLLKKVFALDNIELQRKNFLHAELPTASVIVCYLYPGAMEALSKKLIEDDSQSGYLISNTFALPSYQAEQCLRVDDLYQSPIYRYHLLPR